MLFGNFAESQSRDFDEAIDEDEFAEGYGYSSDSDLEDDEDKNVFSLRQTVKSEVCLLDPFAVPGEESIACEVRDERVEKGKVVKIPDIALVTSVRAKDSFVILLTSLQVPSISDVSLHE